MAQIETPKPSLPPFKVDFFFWRLRLIGEK